MKLKSLFFALCMVFFMSVWALMAPQAEAKVEYFETLSIGTSTTVTTGSSTVLNQASYENYKYFEAVMTYNNLAGIDMRWRCDGGNPDVTVGHTLTNGGVLILRSLADMRNFKACAGTTTAASYGTASVSYILSHEPGKGIEFKWPSYNP